MKLQELKKVLKEVVREAFKEEMRDILLEAVRGGGKSPLQEQPQTISTSQPQQQQPQSNPNRLSKEQLREIYESHLDTSPRKKLNVTSTDTVSEGSSLPEGELDLESIQSLMNKR